MPYSWIMNLESAGLPNLYKKISATRAQEHEKRIPALPSLPSGTARSLRLTKPNLLRTQKPHAVTSTQLLQSHRSLAGGSRVSGPRCSRPKTRGPPVANHR